MSSAGVAEVFAAGLVAALATGLGVLPLLLVRRRSGSLLGGANAFAGGVMLSIALVLVLEGVRDSPPLAVAGAALGVLLVLVARRRLSERLLEPVWLQGADPRRALLVVAVMAAHSLAEGIALGSSFGAGSTRGLATAAALAAHKTAEGLAICLVLVPRGARLRTAAAWSIATALPEPLVAVPAFVAVEAAGSILPLVLGMAAGAMATVVLAELLPEALVHARRRLVVAAAAAAALAVASALQLVLA
jgi:zinc transporter, ZIP family